MWRFEQATGRLSHDGHPIATGYSGLGADKGVPSAQSHRGTGPIPVGRWRIGMIAGDLDTGPLSLLLAPVAGTVTFGRTGFRIHGDSIARPGTASHGCIIMPRAARQRIQDSGDRDLEVVA